ncbi:MAG: UDP-3-O-(3-hydroxymyristoyl)glucosamine N-acyltransferase [Myxococcales bacterium]|nr:MAG: UDP-3-O-(3-hydroxymyristoyl)glucosamine N-acyltransferase [Myxococcales bacterium]
MKLQRIAECVGGRLSGDPEMEIVRANTLAAAEPGELSYLTLNEYREQALTTRASAVLVRSLVEGCPAAQIVVADPYLAFARAMQLIYPPVAHPPGVMSPSVIAEDASIGEGATVYPFVFIGKRTHIGRRTVIHPHVFIGDDVTIGDDAAVHSHVSIREGSVIGHRAILQNGCRIGSDGYGFARDDEGRHIKIPQMGVAVIGDDVEIGANCCIDRATLAETKIGRGTKLDNLVQVGHNVVVGEDCLLVAQVGIAGSSVLGHRVTLAGQVGVSGHLTIGDDATVGGQSGVTRDIPPDEVYTGYPAMPHAKWARLQRLLARLAASESPDDEPRP